MRKKSKMRRKITIWKRIKSTIKIKSRKAMDLRMKRALRPLESYSFS